MSWFNASQLSSFAKQALSQAQKSIDRVLDIKEDETAWADSIITPFQDGKGIPHFTHCYHDTHSCHFSTNVGSIIISLADLHPECWTSLPLPAKILM